MQRQFEEEESNATRETETIAMEYVKKTGK